MAKRIVLHGARLSRRFDAGLGEIIRVGFQTDISKAFAKIARRAETGAAVRAFDRSHRRVLLQSGDTRKSPGREAWKAPADGIDRTFLGHARDRGVFEFSPDDGSARQLEANEQPHFHF